MGSSTGQGGQGGPPWGGGFGVWTRVMTSCYVESKVSYYWLINPSSNTTKPNRHLFTWIFNLISLGFLQQEIYVLCFHNNHILMLWQLEASLILEGQPPSMASQFLEMVNSPASTPSKCKPTNPPTTASPGPSHSRPLFPCLNHPRARHQTVRMSPTTQSPLGLSKLANPKSAHHSPSVAFPKEITVKALVSIFLLPLFASWEPWCFPVWPRMASCGLSPVSRGL